MPAISAWWLLSLVLVSDPHFVSFLRRGVAVLFPLPEPVALSLVLVSVPHFVSFLTETLA